MISAGYCFLSRICLKSSSRLFLMFWFSTIIHIIRAKLYGMLFIVCLGWSWMFLFSLTVSFQFMDWKEPVFCLHLWLRYICVYEDGRERCLGQLYIYIYIYIYISPWTSENGVYQKKYATLILRLRANGRNNSQHCYANNVGSCFVRVSSAVQTDATTPTNVGTCSASWKGYNP